MSKPHYILDAVIELLSDGRERTTQQIAVELSPKLDRTVDTIEQVLSTRARDDRRLRRRRGTAAHRGRAPFVYTLAANAPASSEVPCQSSI